MNTWNIWCGRCVRVDDRWYRCHSHFLFRGKLLVGWKNDFKEILFSEEDRRGTEKEGTWHDGTGDMKDLKDMRLGEGSREVNRNGGNGWKLQVFWKILWCQNCVLVCRFILQMFNLTESLRQFLPWNSRNSPKVSDGEHALKSADWGRYLVGGGRVAFASKWHDLPCPLCWLLVFLSQVTMGGDIMCDPVLKPVKFA